MQTLYHPWIGMYVRVQAEETRTTEFVSRLAHADYNVGVLHLTDFLPATHAVVLLASIVSRTDT